MRPFPTVGAIRVENKSRLVHVYRSRNGKDVLQQIGVLQWLPLLYFLVWECFPFSLRSFLCRWVI